MTFFWEVTLRESEEWTAKLEANFNFPEWKPLIHDESPWSTVAQVDSPGYGTKGNQLNTSALWYKLFSYELCKDTAMLFQNKLAFNSILPPASSALSDSPTSFLAGHKESPREQMISFNIEPSNYTPSTPHPGPKPGSPLYLFCSDRGWNGNGVPRGLEGVGEVAFGKRRGRRIVRLCVLSISFSD